MNYNPWDFIKSATTQRDGNYAPAAFSTAELEVGTAVAKIDLNPKLTEPDRKLFGFFCEALMSRSLSNWLRVLLSNAYELDRWYNSDSILRMAGAELVDILEELYGLPFSLKYVEE